GMLRNLMGLSAAQAGALITQYADDAGNPILADIKDDLDYDGGEAHIWASCRAYLSGDQVTGAREAIHWATEEANGIERMWQSDRETIVAAMETLDENDRWELVHSEGFPELRSTVL